MFSFSEEVCLAYEAIPVPLAYFQRSEDKIVPILVSDGLCKMMHADRPALIEHLGSSMFERVHPDDAGRITRAVRDFSSHISGYNVVYRSNYMGDEGYRYIHSVGRYQPTPDGSDLAVFVYTDISDNEGERNELLANYELSQRDRLNDDAYWRQRYIIEAFSLALSKQWIKVYYQPIVRASDKQTVKLEALARWIDPTRGTISPGDFIPALTKYYLLHRLDLYMLEQVCRETRIRREIGLPLIPVSVNFSAQDFDHVDMVAELVRITAKYEVSHDSIIIEITEQDIAQGTRHFLDQLKAVREQGFRLWLDDFGSGYSSLNVFSQYDVDLVKFDMNLLRHLDDHNGVNRTIMRTMVAMARELGIHTLAEGVEKSDHDEFIGSIGCELEQGFFFYKPEPLDDHIFKFKKRVGNHLSQEQIDRTLAWINPEEE